MYIFIYLALVPVYVRQVAHPDSGVCPFPCIYIHTHTKIYAQKIFSIDTHTHTHTHTHTNPNLNPNPKTYTHTFKEKEMNQKRKGEKKERKRREAASERSRATSKRAGRRPVPGLWRRQSRPPAAAQAPCPCARCKRQNIGQCTRPVA